MWATYPKMQEALDLIEAWGFKYKSIAFQWIKQNRSGNGYFFGLGRWTRGNTEPCLIAIKGKPKRISAGVGQLVFSPLRDNVPEPPTDDWQLTTCPVCGAECWQTDTARRILALEPDVRTACTACALKGLGK